jgi:signal transduction histidine kinase
VSTTRAAAVAEWWPWLVLPAVATGLVSVGLTLGLTDPNGNWITGEAWVNIPLAIGFSTVAAGIWATRPHPVGVLRLGVLYTVTGLAAACVLPTFGLARLDIPGALAWAWVSNWVWTLGAAPLIGVGLVLYPDGRLPGRRWWPALALGIGGPAVMAIYMALTPGPLENHPEFDNPVGFGNRAVWEEVGGAGFLSLIAAAMVGLAALLVKYRRAPKGGDVRGQIRGFLIAAGLVVAVASLPTHEDATSTLLGVLFTAALPITVGVAVLRHRLLDQREGVEALQRKVGTLSESRRRLVDEREEERARLRRELHDGLGPSLAAIGLGLRQLEQHAEPDDEESVRLMADEVQRAVAEVRRICDGLRPAALNELGLPGALAEAMEPLKRFGPSITLLVDKLPSLAPAVEVAAYRIVMEAATNAVRHANAQHIDVTVGYDGGLVLQIGDDGTGLSAELRPGVGLRGMRERADEVGGWLTTTNGEAHGTRVRAWLPGVDHG